MFSFITTFLLNSTQLSFFFSTNVTVTDSPFQITTNAAKEVVEKASEFQEALPINPIGKL
jgi:hypothetical protein